MKVFLQPDPIPTTKGKTMSNDHDPSDPCAVVTTVMLSTSQARALAQLCKRLGWTDATRLSADEAEARAQINAADRLRAALEDAGIFVR